MSVVRPGYLPTRFSFNKSPFFISRQSGLSIRLLLLLILTTISGGHPFSNSAASFQSTLSKVWWFVPHHWHIVCASSTKYGHALCSEVFPSSWPKPSGCFYPPPHDLGRTVADLDYNSSEWWVPWGNAWQGKFRIRTWKETISCLVSSYLI